MDLLTIVRTVGVELGVISLPSSIATVVNSTDATTQQLLALANREGNELFRAKDWTFLQTEFIVNLATPLNRTGTVTTGSQVITAVSSTTGIVGGYFMVSGDGMPSAQRVISVDAGASTVTCEMESTATATAEALIFSRDTYDLPTDFDHYISKTWWDRTNHWMLVGPQSPQFDQWQRSGIVTTGPRRRWRQIGKQPTVYRLWPPPSATSVPAALVFEYISNGWVASEGGTTYTSIFAADTDVPVFNPQMLMLGMKWRFFQIKGFDYAALQSEYNDFVNREKARDGGMPDLSLTRRRQPYLITSANVQDGFFPG